MGRITIEGTPVALFSDSDDSSSFPISTSGHLLLIYQDDAGNEFAVRGGPSRRGGDEGYGPLILEINQPIAESVDRRLARDASGNLVSVTPASRGSREIPLDGRNAEDVWNTILQHARNINAQALPYDPLGNNSNGTVGNLLDLIGVDVNDVLPDPDGVMVLPFSGKDERFDFNYTIAGTEGNDKIVGRGGNQTFTGGEGSDTLSGGTGNDTLDGGGSVDDKVVFSDDFENYEFIVSADGTTVTITHSGGSGEDGTDTVTNVEFAQFADRTVPLIGGDIVFVIDATGSMSDDIAAVRSQANQIIDQTVEQYPLTRFSIVIYRDPGETQTITPFTTDPDEARAGIDSISVGGGGDIPEGVNSGLLHALRNEQEMGSWRPRPTPRSIILMGDAPAKDTELREQVITLAGSESITIDDRITPDSLGLRSLSTPEVLATASALPVSVFSIAIGGSSDTLADFQEVAVETGGKAFTASDAGDVVPALLDAIEEATQSPIAVQDAAITASDAVLTIDVLANDSDPNGDSLTVTEIQDNAVETGGQITLSSGAILTLNAEGSLTYNPNGQFNALAVGETATDTFTYTVADNDGRTDTTAVTVTINRVESPAGITGLFAINFSQGKRGISEKGDSQNNILQGTGRNDALRGMAGNDRLFGKAGQDRLFGGNGKDRLFGGGGNDRLLGENGNDQLEGGNGRDWLRGGKGRDLLRGNGGSDILEGGLQRDTLTGGSGGDLLVFNSVAEGADIVTDFTSAQDLIDLRRIFALPEFAGNGFSSRFNQFVQLNQAGANTEVKIDIDGNGSSTSFQTLATLQNVLAENISIKNFVLA